MTEPAKCITVMDAVDDTLVVAARLVDKSLVNSPKLIIAALQSDKGQEAIKNALQQIANERLKDTPVQFSAEEARKLAQKLQGAGGQGFKDGVLEQVKKSHEYQRLEKSAEQLVKALKCSPAGVWVDEHEALVYIVGAGLILGGATALYVTRTGDAVTDPLTTLLKDQKAKVRVRQNIEISAGLARFVPSNREVEVNAQAIAKWKPLEIKLNVVVHAVNEKFSVSGDGQVILPFYGGVARLEGSYNARDPKVAPMSLGLGIALQPGGVRIDIMGRLQFRNLQPTGGSVDIRVGPSRTIPLSLSGTGTSDQEKTSVVLSIIGNF
jgi:hypothetical protein